MRIILLANVYAPEDVSGAVLVTELATDLAKAGHEITVVTCVPNYPYGRVYDGYRNGPYQVESLSGVRVVRTWSHISPSKNFWSRAFAYGSYCATAFWGALLTGKPDIIVSFSPPLPLGLSAWLLTRLWHVPWVLQIEDVYPEAAVAAGVIRRRKAIRFFSALERFLYSRATHISLIAETFRRNLLTKGVPPEKITLIPVWADPDVVKPLPKENAFRNQHGLDGQFVVMYAGTLGYTSALKEVLDAAEILRDERDIRFLIIGEGVKKAGLQETVRRKGLENILFLPFQQRQAFAEMLAAADVGLVTLNHNSSHTSLPSKAFNIMASGRPILALAPHDSEIADLVGKARCGIVIPPERPALLAEGVLNLRDHPGLLGKMGRNGRARLETDFSRKHCVEMYQRMLSGLYGKNDTTCVTSSPVGR